MSEQTEHKIDRSRWPVQHGPWMDEPDKLNWKTTAGLPGMIVRAGTSGNLCGYVAVTNGHPCFGRDFMSEYEKDADGEDDYSRRIPNPVQDLDVHGGITYGHSCAGVICHVPEPGEPDDVWWLGFDCGHSGDFSPAYMDDSQFRISGYYVSYKDVEYVRREVESLARQLAEMGAP